MMGDPRLPSEARLVDEVDVGETETGLGGDVALLALNEVLLLPRR